MSRGQERFKRPANQGAHSKCLQTVFCKKAGRPAENFRFDAENGQASRNGRELKLQRDCDVWNGEREKLKGCSRYGGPFTAPVLASLWARGKLGERKGRARWNGVRLGGRSEFFVKREKTFAQKSHGVLEKGREKQSKKSWDGQDAD